MTARGVCRIAGATSADVAIVEAGGTLVHPVETVDVGAAVREERAAALGLAVEPEPAPPPVEPEPDELPPAARRRQPGEPDRRSLQPMPRTQRAIDLLQTMLSTGPRTYRELMQAAGEAGITVGTMNYAASAMGVVREIIQGRSGRPRMWRLPTGEPAAPRPGQRAVSLLRELLRDGPRPAVELYAAAATARVCKATLYAAARELGIEYSPHGAGVPAVWRLPTTTGGESAA